jgi:hypothetical protein
MQYDMYLIMFLYATTTTEIWKNEHFKKYMNIYFTFDISVQPCAFNETFCLSILYEFKFEANINYRQYWAIKNKN